MPVGIHKRSAIAYLRPMRWFPLFLSLGVIALAADAAAGPAAAKGRAVTKKVVVAPKKAAVKPKSATPKAKKARSQKRPRPAPPAVPDNLEQRWLELQQGAKPVVLAKLCEDFERDFPASAYGQAAKDICLGAQRALGAQRVARLSSDALEEPAGDADYRIELARAWRGDKAAAGRIAEMYGQGSNGLAPSPRRNEQWLQFAAELGNGSASWKLAEILNLSGQWADAARYERKSAAQGFVPPPRLKSKARDF